MKWALTQLFKYNKRPFTFEVEYDFHDRIQDIDDILDISIVKVRGTGRNLIADRYIFEMHIECILTLECSRTLDPIDLPINLDVIEEFDIVDDGEVNVIEKNTIDIDNVVWENIYLEKPMRVFKEDSNSFDEDTQVLEEFYKTTNK